MRWAPFVQTEVEHLVANASHEPDLPLSSPQDALHQESEPPVHSVVPDSETPLQRAPPGERSGMLYVGMPHPLALPAVERASSAPPYPRVRFCEEREKKIIYI